MNSQDKNYSVAIVGGGIIGLSIALTLQESGENVLLIDKNTIASGASRGNAGHIATEQVFPIASLSILAQVPKMLLDPLSPLRLDWKYFPTIFPWLMRLISNMRPSKSLTIHQALKALNKPSLQAWEDFTKHWECQKYLRTQGSLLITEDKHHIAKLQQEANKLSSIGVPTQWLNQSEVHDYEPLLQEKIVGAILFPETGHIYNLDELLEHLKSTFIRLGGQLQENTEIFSIQQQNEKFVLSSQGKNFISSRIIIATGAYSKKWVKALTGITVPLDTERGYHLMLPEHTNLLSIPVTSYEKRFIMTPMEQGLRLAGTVEYAGLEAPPNMQRAHQLYSLAKSLLKPTLSNNHCKEWMGFRPSIADSLPVIDRKNRIIFAFGHQHLGLTQAPITANLVHQLYFNKPTSINLNAYRLDRF